MKRHRVQQPALRKTRYHGRKMSHAKVTRLVRPSAHLERSHASFVREVLDRREGLVPWVLAEVGDNFEQYVIKLESQSQGIDLPAGFVPSSTFWLLDRNVLAPPDLVSAFQIDRTVAAQYTEGVPPFRL